MEIAKILYGHTSHDNAYVVEDFPYRGVRILTKSYWIDTHPKNGDRVASVVVNPVTKRLHRIKYSPFHTLMFLFLDKEGAVQQAGYNFRLADDVKFMYKKMVDQVDLVELSDTQQENIRRHFLVKITKEATYVHAVLPMVQAERYRHWLKDVILFIQTRPLNEIHLFPAEPDLPEK